jgi:hypothetical protein
MLTLAMKPQWVHYKLVKTIEAVKPQWVHYKLVETIEKPCSGPLAKHQRKCIFGIMEIF